MINKVKIKGQKGQGQRSLSAEMSKAWTGARGATMHLYRGPSSIYRLLGGTLANMLIENKDPALKTVGARLFTGRHIHRQTDRQT